MRKLFAVLVLVLFVCTNFYPANASVVTESTKISYSGSGTTGPFSFNFKVWNSSELLVLKTLVSTGAETTLTLNTDYTVTLLGSGGTVTLTAALASGYTLTIMRDMPYLQGQNYTSNITPSSLNNALDKLDHQIQQLKEQADRSFQVPRSAGLSSPYMASSAGNVVRWRLDGYGLEAVPLAGVAQDTFLQSGTGAVSRTVQAKLGEVYSVKDFGAIGDGTTDDTDAIIAAIKAVGHGELFWPAGSYAVTKPLIVRYAQRWRGEGRGRVLTPWGADTQTITEIKAVGDWTAYKAVMTRVIYRDDVSDAQDDPLSAVVNVQFQNFEMEGITIKCDYDQTLIETDPTTYDAGYIAGNPTEFLTLTGGQKIYLGANVDCGIFNGSRMHMKLKDVGVIGGFRMASVYTDVSTSVSTGYTAFTGWDGLPFPTSGEVAGADGHAYSGLITWGARWGVKVQGAEPKSGLKSYGKDYTLGLDVDFASAPVEGDTITFGEVTFTFTASPTAGTDVPLRSTAALSVSALADTAEDYYADEANNYPIFNSGLYYDDGATLRVFCRGTSTAEQTYFETNFTASTTAPAVMVLSSATPATIADPAKYYEEGVGLLSDSRGAYGFSDFSIEHSQIFGSRHPGKASGAIAGWAPWPKRADKDHTIFATDDGQGGSMSISGLAGNSNRALHGHRYYDVRFDSNAAPFNVKLGRTARDTFIDCHTDNASVLYSTEAVPVIPTVSAPTKDDYKYGSITRIARITRRTRLFGQDSTPTAAYFAWDDAGSGSVLDVGGRGWFTGNVTVYRDLSLDRTDSLSGSPRAKLKSGTAGSSAVWFGTASDADEAKVWYTPSTGELNLSGKAGRGVRFRSGTSTLGFVYSVSGTATGGGASTITLGTGVSAACSGAIITITAGPGVGESKEIIAHDVTTGIATVESAWATPPTSASTYTISPFFKMAGDILPSSTSTYDLGSPYRKWAKVYANDVEFSSGSLGTTSYGVVGMVADGSADNSTVLQAEMDRLETLGGGRIIIPSGYYRFDTKLQIPSNVTLEGSGVDEWEPVYPSRAKKWGGTNLIFKGTGTRNLTFVGVTGMKESGGFLTNSDTTGSTDGATGVITGMTDTSFFCAKDYVTVSAGFATTGPFKVLSVTSTTVTLDATSNAIAAGVTVTSTQGITSFYNADAGASPATTAATPRNFSAAITNKVGAHYIGVKNLRIVNWAGTNGMTDHSNTGLATLGDSWDIGLLLRDTEYANISNVQSVGYWREFGALMIETVQTEARSERNRFERCKFQGRVGVGVRAADRWDTTALTANTITIYWTDEEYFDPAGGTFRGSNGVDYTYTGIVHGAATTLQFTGVTPDPTTTPINHIRHAGTGFGNSEFYDCYAYSLYHVSSGTAEDFSLANSQPLEVSGYPLRGVKFRNFKMHTDSGAIAFLHDASDIVFVDPQFEGGSHIIANPSQAEAVSLGTCNAAMGETRNLVMIGEAGVNDSNLALFRPRSGFIQSLSFAPRSKLTEDLTITPMREGADIVMEMKTGQNFYVRKDDGSTNVFRVTNTGNVVVEGGGQLSLTGGTAYINSEAAENMAFRTATSTRMLIYGTSGNIVPGADNSQDWGSSTAAWRKIYAGTSVYIGANRIEFATAAPTTGTYKQGDIIKNSAATLGQPVGWVCTVSGTFSAATDNTGDTDGATAVITGMTDTSDFAVGQYATVSAGFASTGPYEILNKSASTITLDTNSNAVQANITVSTTDPTFVAEANL